MAAFLRLVDYFRGWFCFAFICCYFFCAFIWQYVVVLGPFSALAF